MNRNIIKLKFPYKSKPDYVGLIMKEGKIEFTFPVGYFEGQKEDLEVKELDEEYRKIIINLLRIMSRYRKIDSIGDYNSEKSEFPIEAYLWIIRDYIENGYYNDVEIRYKSNETGKINWKKTIKNNKSFLNDSRVYKELITKETRFGLENEITNIHRFCVQTAINIFGFLFGISYKIINKLELDNKLKLSWKQILIKELTISYNDHKRLLLKNMIDMLESLDFYKLKKNEFSLIAKDFNYVFESLIDERFGTEFTNQYYPQGEWILNNRIHFPSSDIRPDTIRINKNNIYVIDSKYYMYGYTKNTKDLPETSSIHKQITYANFIDNERNPEKKDIYNIFILPKNCSYSKEEVSYIGYAKLTNENKKYNHIYTFLIDLRKLIENKLSESCFEKMEEIIKKQGGK